VRLLHQAQEAKIAYYVANEGIGVRVTTTQGKPKTIEGRSPYFAIIVNDEI
jgi:hypothetical protein